MKIHRLITETHLRLDRYFPDLPLGRTSQIGYVIVLTALAVIVQLLTPISMGDTDMWYHLSDGRFFWENGKIADHYFYSFVPGNEPWFNHFWGFQAAIFPVYENFGYQGLLILRAAIVSATLVIIALFLFHHPEKGRFWFKTIAFFLITYLILTRGYQLRPHLMSYLMIPVFLLVLEHHRKYVFLLPLLTVIWVNTHSVEWVIGALICGAYFLDEINQSNIDRKYLLGILLCALAMLITPNPLDTIMNPFSIPADFDKYIAEMKAIDPVLLYSMNLSLKDLLPNSAFTALVVLVVASLIVLFIDGSLKIRHLILAIASFYLLSKGTRFIWEWSLLNMPAVYHAALVLKSHQPSTLPKYHKYLLLAVSLYPLYIIGSSIDYKQDYPFNANNLPTGIVKFLKHAGAQGNLIVPHNEAGFVQQQLYPEILIHSDMKSNVPLFAELKNALTYPTAFKRLTEKYRIDFVMLTSVYNNLHTQLHEQGYKIVFLDDTGVLYAHNELQSDLIAKYPLAIDLYKDIKEIDTNLFLAEMKKLLSIDRNNRILLAIIMKLSHEQQYEEALDYAHLFYQQAKNKPASAYWLGNLNHKLERCERAISYFEISLENADKALSRDIKKQMGSCYYLMEDFHNAYAYFDESLNMYLEKESIEDLFQYAYSALITGRLKQAENILQSIIDTAPEEKDEIRNIAINLQQEIISGKYDAPGFFNWAFQQTIGIFTS